MVMLTKVTNASPYEVIVQVDPYRTKDLTRVPIQKTVAVNLSLPEIKDGNDYKKGIFVRHADQYPDLSVWTEAMYIWDNKDFNVKFKDVSSGRGESSYPGGSLHINWSAIHSRYIQLIVMKKGFILMNDDCPAFLGYYPEKADGSSVHKVYTIQRIEGDNERLLVTPSNE